LKPKKIKDLIPQLSKELQLSKEEIESVLDVYWDKVRKTLSSLDHNRVNLKGLGTFYIKPWSIEKKIKANDNVIERYVESPTTGGLTIMNNLLKDNMKLKKAQERETESLKKKEEKRYERHNQSLEGEEQDS
jgi:nucleoid DNA-binding protein